MRFSPVLKPLSAFERLNLRRPNAETLTLLGLMAATAITAALVLKTGRSPEEQDSLSATARGWGQVLVLYGSWFFVLTLLSYVAWFRKLKLFSFLRESISAIAPEFKSDLWPAIRQCFSSPSANAVLLAALFIGIMVRAYFVSQPIRYDEAYTVINFAGRNLDAALTYTLPNNQVLHTLLLKLSVAIFGVHPATIRLPVFLFGVFTIVPVFCISRLAGGSGGLAALAASVHPYMILYSTNARGYAITAFLTLILILVGWQARAKPSRGCALLFALVAAPGLLATPSMAFPLAGIWLWLGLGWWRDSERSQDLPGRVILPSVILTVSLALLLYTPVVLATGGIPDSMTDRLVGSASLTDLFIRLVAHGVWSTNVMLRDVPVILWVIGLILLCGGAFLAYRNQRWREFDLLPCLIVGAGLLILVHRRPPSEGGWLYVVPLLLIAADSGYASGVEARFPRIRRPVFVAASILAFLMAGRLISREALANYPDTGAFAEAESTARVLTRELGEGDLVFVPLPADWPVYFYVWYDGVRSQQTGKTTKKRKKKALNPSSASSIEWIDNGSAIRFGPPGDKENDEEEGERYMLFIPEIPASTRPAKDDPGFEEVLATEAFVLFRSLDPDRLVPQG